MNSDLLITEDWRKQAAADPSMQANEDVEKAFLDQAYMHIQNKATPLMKQQFRVGFEIVHKNDENTRMVGVFVFRVGDQFFYAPVFFLNGSIKGTDLLYRANVKRFVPLNNEWCDYLINLSTMDEGHGISIRERQLTRDQLNLLDIVEPPQMFRYRRKYACWVNKPEHKNDMDEAQSGMQDALEKAAMLPDMPAVSVLRRFITEYGGFNAIKKIANTAKHDKDFARALMLASHPDNYMPSLEPESPAVKRAAVKSSPLIVLHTSVLRNDNVKKASASEMSNGYKIEDFRKEAAVNEYVYADNSQELNSVEAPGVYDILMEDGSSRRVLVGFYHCLDLLGGNRPQPVCSGYDPYNLGGRRKSFVLIDDSEGVSSNLNQESQEFAFGAYRGDIDSSDKLKEMSSAESGKAYRIYDTKQQAFSQAFYVTKKDKSPGGLDRLWVSEYGVDNDSSPILVNSDYEDWDPKDQIFGKRCKLVAVKFHISGDEFKRLTFEPLTGIGNKHALNSFIFENNFKSAMVKHTVEKGDAHFLVKTDRTGQKWHGPYTKLAAVIRLMCDCAVREETAEELLKLAAAASDHTYRFFHEKRGYNMRFNDWPEFYERMNNEFQVLEQPRTNWIMQTEADRPIVMPHRVGDVWSQDSSESIDTMTPLQLYETSKQKGVGSLFEHGVVGELVKTYDANQQVQSYVADLELALDRLGRIIFLFYWKPEDFAASYGTDDQTALENKFLSNFKALGEMTLELLQKAKLQQEGTVSLV